MQLPPREAIDHAPGRAQHWRSADHDVRAWVDATVATVEEAVPTVSAVYLHGSLAMASYFRPKSDVDLVVVEEEPLSESARRTLAAALLDAHDRRPTHGGMEVSVVWRQAVESFEYPTPYEFHFSERWADDVRRGGSGPRGTDPDLAAHFTVTRRRGVALRGDKPTAVIGEVPHDAYVDAVTDDLRWIVDGGILESPFYGVLNVCRALHVALDQPELPPSKDEGARWALENLPVVHRPIVGSALECYRSTAAVPNDLRRVHGHGWEEHPLLDIAAYARRMLDLDQ